MSLVGKLLSLFGDKSPKLRRDAASAYQVPASLIDRHPLSYADPSDPISDETKIEIERQRTTRKPVGTGGMGHL
jgi:hypothetical protein